MARRAGNRKRTWLRLALFVVTAITLLTLDARGSSGVLDTARGATLELLGPVRTLGDRVVTPFRNAWRGVVSYDDLEAENARLRTEVASAQASVLSVGELERDRQELLALLGARDTVRAIPRVAGRVVDAPVSNFEQTIQLAVGQRHGVQVGMPVESGHGLIGRVVQAGPTRSKVELLTDPNFDAGVRLVRSGDEGLASGRGPGRELQLSFIDLETVVIPGETVVTSGFEGSTFPAGLLVGTVTDVTPDAVRGEQRVAVHPAADLNRLRWALVLLYLPDAPEPIVVDRAPPPTTLPPPTFTTVSTPGPAPTRTTPSSPPTTTGTGVTLPSDAPAPASPSTSTPIGTPTSTNTSEGP